MLWTKPKDNETPGAITEKLSNVNGKANAGVP